MFAPFPQNQLAGRPRREDHQDVRVAGLVTPYEGPAASFLEQVRPTDIVVLGYPDDRGIDRNGGRLGAAEGPDEIRRRLYRLTPPPQRTTTDLRIWDLGNLRSWSMDLLEAQEKARDFVADLRKTGARILSLGGGHDWAYSDFQGFEGHVINFDAHLDVRPLPNEDELKGHSGTPFRRILEENKQGKTRVSAVGLQRTSNARAHLEWAEGHRVTPLFLEELPWDLPRQLELVRNKLELGPKAGALGLSIDMDAFPQHISPGVSAPQPFGLDPTLVLTLVRELKASTRQLGLYETSPRLDVDGSTARLAARLAYEFLFA